MVIDLLLINTFLLVDTASKYNSIEALYRNKQIYIDKLILE